MMDLMRARLFLDCRFAFMAISGLAHRPEISRAIGAALGYWPLVIDLAGIAYLQVHLAPGQHCAVLFL